MGRRAADLSTPVPVLGVPALVGVRGWKTTGERTGGALLQTWGLQCSVGVQTSPGISRSATQHSVQLTDTTATPSYNITQTSNSDVTKEILLLTKSDKERRAILKQKRGECKTKKEVTFEALGGEASKDVACSQRNSGGTYCYARAIKTNPHFAGNAPNVRPKLKSAARYFNGSVVDSDAIGGISVDNDETEPVKSATSHERDQTRLQGHYAEQSGRTLLSAVRPFGVPQKICSHCGGRQSVTGAATLGEKSPSAHACPLKSARTSVPTTTHFHFDRNGDLKPILDQTPESITNTNRTHITVNPQILHLNEELMYRKTPHPACPIHSKGNLVTLSHAHTGGDAIATPPTTILHAKTITVTKATIETRQTDATVKSFVKQPQGNKIPRPTSLILTPQMATATKPNNPHSHTYPKLPKTAKHNASQNNVPQNACISAHENTLSHTTAVGPGNTSSTNIHKPVITFNTAVTDPENAKVSQHELLHPLNRAQVDIATNTTDSPKLTLKCPKLSKSTNALDPINLSETTDRPTPASLPHTSCSPTHEANEKPFSNVSVNPTAFSTFANIPNTTVPQFSTLNLNATSDQTTKTSSNHKAKSVATQIYLIQPKSSKSEPTLVNGGTHLTTRSLNTTAETKSAESQTTLSSSAVLSSKFTCNSTYSNTALRNSSLTLKNSTSTASTSSSTLSDNQSNICVSSRNFLQSANATLEELAHNDSPYINKPSHIQATGIRTQTNNESGVCGVVSNQGNNSKTTPLTLSEPLNVSSNHNQDSDAGTHNPNSAWNPNIKSYSNKHKYSGDLIRELDVHKSKDHENSNLSQVTNLQNYISLIKSSSSSLQGCINTEQQRLEHYQGYTDIKHKGQCAPCPPVKTAQETDSNTEQNALGISTRHANIKFKSNADKQKHPNYSTSTSQINCNSPSSANTSAHVDPFTQTSVHQNSDLHVSSLPRTLTGSELSFTAATPFKSEEELCRHTGPECNSIVPPSAMRSASHPLLQSCKADAIVRPDSKFSPAPLQPCPEDTSLAHSHPADAALLLPPSPQCCKSAALQQRLETVEASLAANKDRITTLLNIIHDLEMCHTPTSSREINAYCRGNERLYNRQPSSRLLIFAS
ncbi:serine-rich adhesin for platelets isoform X2 [Mastacembelus armatus]|uniref:serine-rich adhesin for platelets isoform X2 n=1 Tax=Mastacembelus armatus TaxID=205130 RepID=UPI000E463EF0|nr:serine-rich adhesin for platelets-like isoform X2 [Mastacembelus armatus]